MTPVDSRSRSLRWHGATVRPTSAARAVAVIRPSCCSLRKILRSIPSITQESYFSGASNGKTGQHFSPRFHYAGRICQPSRAGAPMDPQSILGFAAVSIALAFTPGADWAYSIAAGIGRDRVAPAVAGLCSGYLMHTLLVVAGVAAL